ncbi:predicted protein [Sclerotinia sclerotiorum 1980 UF-70]|uniref:Uncharacterized protein n=2 Tax=Sclerotinia sclerotiorum (strain ATCC 18683 / 1980 / Ss-1) TaxID=665079 RepID=A7F788_SCLS1|nr:predicted protein [Sclerotinia sclerotiorum 1980 UF-70]APA15518.1 hypothetical protein sscle_15g102880 [Sclerotinia sclerotiorum 1980 UF-70]EDN98609.1 predicted protein [Sclerotinia sclerotiorum 1980 UF-70]
MEGLTRRQKLLQVRIDLKDKEAEGTWDAWDMKSKREETDEALKAWKLQQEEDVDKGEVSDRNREQAEAVNGKWAYRRKESDKFNRLAKKWTRSWRGRKGR